MASALRDPGLVRDAITADIAALATGDMKEWCRRRWQFLFLNEAVKDDVALGVATTSYDRRSPRQRIAERFLIDGAASWQDAQPKPWAGRIVNTTLLFCPGMLNGILPVRAFRDNLPEIEKRFSMRVLRSDSNPLASSAANASDILKAMNNGTGLDAGGSPIPIEAATPPGDVMLLGYSKGGPDIITALATYPELASRVRCAFFWSSPVLGTAAADDTINQLKSTSLTTNDAAAISKTLKSFAPRRLKQSKGVLRRTDEFDTLACIRDLTTAVRKTFMSEHKALLEGMNLPMFTIGAATRLEDVPFVQRRGFKALSRHDAQNDMQVECGRARLPLKMATDLGIVRGHHWDIAYPAYVKRKWWNNMYHGFPKTAAVVSTVQLAAELGLID